MVLDLTAELGSGGDTEASGGQGGDTEETVEEGSGVEGDPGGQSSPPQAPAHHSPVIQVSRRSPPPVPPRSSNSKPRLPTPPL
jgi:hypothetical protein